MDFESRLQKLENEVKRDFRHLDRVMSTQTEIVRKAFDQVQLAMLEQKMAMKTCEERVQSSLQMAGEAHRESSEVARIQREQAAEIEEIKRRLDRLEKPA